MKLNTIWSFPSLTFKERLLRTRDWAALEVACKLPLRVRYWVTITEIGKATREHPHILNATVEEILQKLESPKVVR